LNDSPRFPLEIVGVPDAALVVVEDVVLVVLVELVDEVVRTLVELVDEVVRVLPEATELVVVLILLLVLEVATFVWARVGVAVARLVVMRVGPPAVAFLVNALALRSAPAGSAGEKGAEKTTVKTAKDKNKSNRCIVNERVETKIMNVLDQTSVYRSKTLMSVYLELEERLGDGIEVVNLPLYQCAAKQGSNSSHAFAHHQPLRQPA